MKPTSLLFALCMLISLGISAQTTEAKDQPIKRITITTTKVDENGKSITETWIGEGQDPAKLIQEMAINPQDIKTINIEGDAKAVEGERIFLYRAAGDQVTVEGKLDDNVSLEDTDKVIIVTKGDNGQEITRTIKPWNSGNGQNSSSAWFYAGNQKSNCAALGVFADAHSGIYGAQISRIIDQGAAQAAGLKEGDIIKNVDEFEVSDFSTLFFALSHYRAGDQVVIRYERDGKSQNAKATLKDWAQIPGFEYKARTDCGEPDLPVTGSSRRDETDGPTGTIEIQPLELQDARIYPNPTDGAFTLSFNAKPGPLSVSISDANGKEVFRDVDTHFPGNYNRDIDLKGMPQGNYIITVSQGDKVFTQQISKQ